MTNQGKVSSRIQIYVFFCRSKYLLFMESSEGRNVLLIRFPHIFPISIVLSDSMVLSVFVVVVVVLNFLWARTANYFIIQIILTTKFVNDFIKLISLRFQERDRLIFNKKNKRKNAKLPKVTKSNHSMCHTHTRTYALTHTHIYWDAAMCPGKLCLD